MMDFRVRSLLFCCLLLGLSRFAAATCSAEAQLAVQVLGSGGPELNDGRASSGYLIWRGDRAVVLVDSGSGSLANFETSGAQVNDLQAVLFTHFHVDHSADFPALIKGSFFTGRDTDLPVYGPAGNELMPGAKEFVAGLFGQKGIYRYLAGFLVNDRAGAYRIRVTEVPLSPHEIHRYTVGDLRLSAVPVQHGPVAAVAWRVDIDGCSMAFSGDLNNSFGTLTRLAKAADLLVANNAIREDSAGVARFLHMPPSEIGKIAAAADVSSLILSHRMLRTLGREQETERQIQRFYAGPLHFADDLDRFPVPELLQDP